MLHEPSPADVQVGYYTVAVRKFWTELRAQRGAAEAGPSPYKTLPEAAAYLRLSRKALYHEVAKGRLRPFRVGRKLLFTEALLRKYVQQRKGR